MYTSFVRPLEVPRVEISESESREFGMSVGRLTVWPSGVLNGAHAMRLVEDSGCDLVIVRYPSEDTAFAVNFQWSDWISWTADTLMYFEGTVEPADSKISSVALRRAAVHDAGRAAALVREIFDEYRNHYSSNPLLKAVSAAAAYEDWVLLSLDSPERSVFIAEGQDGVDVGLCMMDESDPDFDEVLLAGISPAFRRLGLYSSMLRLLRHRSARNGKRCLAISTQTSNMVALRAWCKLGFVPTVSVNTMHVMRRELLTISDSPQTPVH